MIEKKLLLDREEKAILVSVVTREQRENQVVEYLDELAFLAETAGATTVKRFIQKLPAPDSRTYIGKGKLEEIKDYTIGQKFSVDIFEIGETVNITGFTIGKGNAGNIKQHHFSRGAMTHGGKSKRLQGSMGSGTTPGRVYPGKKMPGRFGMEKRTIKGLEIIDIDINNNLIVVKGSIPGKSGKLVSMNSGK
jgi:large subunit ribosomal protein L3